MRSKKLWLILGILVLAVIGLVSYFSLRPPQPQVTSHALTGYVLEVTPEMNRITVRNADVPGIMASGITRHRAETLAEHVYDLSLALVAPLGAQHYRRLRSHRFPFLFS